MTLAPTISAVPNRYAAPTLLEGFPGVATAVGYVLPEDLDFDTFREVVGRLIRMEQSSGWWLGDALIQLEA